MPRFFLCLLATLSFIAWVIMVLYNGIMFDIKMGDYLKRAADANTIELALDNLTTALRYAQFEKLTSGNTGVLWKTPARDVGFWNQNLRASYLELVRVQPEATQLEKSNILLKLRETLLDHGHDGDTVTIPPEISLFPENALYFWWGWLSAVLVIVSFGVAGIRKFRNY